MPTTFDEIRDAVLHMPKGDRVRILSAVAILADHQILRAKDGFPAVGDTELALVAAPDASPATRRLADVLAEFCAGASPRAAA